MNANENQGDPVLGALCELRRLDVSHARAERLRASCLNGLKMPSTPGEVSRRHETDPWRAARVLASAWCVLYLLETIQRAAAAYGF